MILRQFLKYSVIFSFLKCITYFSNQVPHAFQDILGAEMTPTLCYSIFAFSAFIQRWTELKEEYPEWERYIEPGLDKLDDYSYYLDQVPAYTIAMGNVFLFIYKLETDIYVLL